MPVRREASRTSAEPKNSIRVNGNYRTGGSVAYAPAYDSSAVRNPRRSGELPQPGEEPSRRQRTRKRSRIRVREAGEVAPFAVVSFVAVMLIAVMLLASYAQYLSVSDDIVKLQSEMTQLKTENSKLASEYERLFDISAIQEAVGEEMIQPTGDQVVYIDLSQPDTVTVFDEGSAGNPILFVLQEFKDVLGGLKEYFG